MNNNAKYDMKTVLDIAESIATILMFIMAVWGTIISYEEGFWHKLNHIVDHYHQKLAAEEATLLQKTENKMESDVETKMESSIEEKNGAKEEAEFEKKYKEKHL